MLREVGASSYVRKFPIGSTKPFIVTDTTGDSFVCKLYEEDLGNRHLINEFVCYNLAKLLNLPIPEATLVLFDDEIIESSPELKERKIKSRIGFGSKLLHNVKTNINPVLLESCKNPEVIPNLVLFDQIILNIDRATNDGNLLFNFKTKELIVIDHSHVFKHGTIWDATTLAQTIESNDLLVENFNKKYYRMLTRYINGYNPFKDILERIEILDNTTIVEIVKSVPPEWELDELSGQALIQFIQHRIQKVPEILKAMHDQSPYWKGVI